MCVAAPARCIVRRSLLAPHRTCPWCAVLAAACLACLPPPRRTQGFFRIKRGSNECRIEEWYPSFASPHFGGAAVVPTSSVVGQGGSVQLGIVAAAAPSSSQASSGSGYIALVSASNPNGAPVARVDASSAVDGLASISTAGVAAGSYFVRFCESATSTVASGCTLLDDKIVISHCASTGGEAECSGHGTCGANGACTCDAGYGGNDCSARLCPAMPALKCGCVAYGGVWEQTPDLLQGTPSSSGGGTVLYSLSLAAPATVHLSTCRAGTDVDTVVSIFAGCPLSGGSGAPLAPIAMADDEGCGAESGATAAGGVTAGTSIGLTRGSVVKADLAAGSYVVAVSSANHFALGGFELAVNGCASTGSACAPKPAPVSAMSVAADACAGARPLVLGSQVSGDLSSGHPLLYRLELPSEVKDGSVAPPASALISTCGSAADTELRVGASTPLPSLAQLRASVVCNCQLTPPPASARAPPLSVCWRSCTADARTAAVLCSLSPTMTAGCNPMRRSPWATAGAGMSTMHA